MRFSKLFCQTLKEAPQEAHLPSHQLLIRAGFIKMVASGIYVLLPLAERVIKKIETIIRNELDELSANECSLPILCPESLWIKSQRWNKYGPELMRIKDRNKSSFCLSPTHEEMVSDLVSQAVNSYKELPFCLYQIGSKFRDEIRPRFGLMRAKEFKMKDAYSFHADHNDLSSFYKKMQNAYQIIFDRCGIQTMVVEADSGSIGGDVSAEFMVCAENGEDLLVQCSKTKRVFNIEALSFTEPAGYQMSTPSQIKKVETKMAKSILDVANYLDIETKHILKSLVYKIDDDFVLLLCRGDHEFNDVKLGNFFDSHCVCMATDEEVKKIFGQLPGNIGPYLLPQQIKVLADFSVKEMRDFVVGANEIGYHFRGLNLNDFKIDQFADLRLAKENEPSPFHEEGYLVFKRGIEVGHIFKLGQVYSEKFSASYLDDQGKNKLIQMGCYGIGIGRTMAAAVEQSHDKKGIIWPLEIAPYKAIIIISDINHKALIEIANRIYQCRKDEILLDDRNCRIGVKFKDAELIGIPLQIIIGKKCLESQEIECQWRHSSEKFFAKEEIIIQKLLDL